jgi:hypothetical protein
VFLGTGTMVVCLKQVSITDRIRDRLKMSVKMSAHALSMPPGILSGLVNGDLFKGLPHIDYRERDHTVVRKS